jgi:hypothetical protein
MAYTQEGIMAQILVAFGQGTGAIRVSQDAALELRRWYFDAITPIIINTQWETESQPGGVEGDRHREYHDQSAERL